MGLCASRNKVPVETTATATATAESKPKGRYFLGNRGRSSSSPETRHSTGGEYASSMSARSGTHSQSNTTGRASTSSSMKKGSFSEKENSSYPSPGSPNSEGKKLIKRLSGRLSSSKHLAGHRDSLTLHVKKVRVRATSEAPTADESNQFPSLFSAKSFSVNANQPSHRKTPETHTSTEPGNVTRVRSFIRAHTMPTLPVKAVKKINVNLDEESVQSNASTGVKEGTHPANNTAITVTAEHEDLTEQGNLHVQTDDGVPLSGAHNAWSTPSNVNSRGTTWATPLGAVKVSSQGTATSDSDNENS